MSSRFAARRSLRAMLLFSVAMVATGLTCSMALAQSPNIVLVLTDDQSWNGTSVLMDPSEPESRSDFYQTPRLAELAAQGMRFSNGYSSAAVCAPTRAAILTGSSPAQLQMTDLPTARPSLGDAGSRWRANYYRLPLTPPAPQPLDRSLTTLPQLLKQVNPNYGTALYGKWHLDVPLSYTPTSVGYDSSGDPRASTGDEKGSAAVTNLANDFMAQQVSQGKPFFVQVATHAVHSPVNAPQHLIDKYEAIPSGTYHWDNEYAAMTEDLDNGLGSIMDKLVELGIEDNTYVIFTSDNGAPRSLSWSDPLRRSKTEVYEGGIRVPFVVKGPGVQAGSVSDVPISTTDLYATVASLAGHTGTLPDHVEAADFSSVLHNGGDLPAGVSHLSRNHHEGGELYWHNPHNHGASASFRVKPSSAVRDGDYKLYVEYAENGGTDQYALYNLATDISETTNLRFSQPAKFTELKDKLDNYLQSVDASFAFAVSDPVVMEWSATSPGTDPDAWRSQLRVKNKIRETFNLGEGAQRPAYRHASNFQSNLGDGAMHFDGNDVAQRMFFQVSDRAVQKNVPSRGTSDLNRSAAMEFWIRMDTTGSEQILFESGGTTTGLSVTFGDSDADGKANDVRLRVLGNTVNDTLQDLTVTAKVDRFLNPTEDFFHVVTVFNDDPSDRYGEIYVNGALAARVNGASGAEESILWDLYDGAALGGVSLSELGGPGGQVGGSGGTGDLPFTGGGFQGDLATFRFYNHAIDGAAVQTRYNAALAPADQGIASLAGQTVSPEVRPVDISLDSFESSGLTVIQERTDTLAQPLGVDAIVTPGLTIDQNTTATEGTLFSGLAFRSYLLQFDPASNTPGISETVSGSVEFDRAIAGFLFDEDSLTASDPVLGSLGDYGEASDRGLLFGEGDFLTISPDRMTLDFSLSVAGDEMLQFRVLTSLLIDGDLDLNNIVDGQDFLTWQRGYDAEYSEGDLQLWAGSYGIGIPSGGDFDANGIVNGADFLAWQQGLGIRYSPASLAAWKAAFGENSAAPATSAVPEPGTACLALLGLAMLGRRRVDC